MAVDAHSQVGHNADLHADLAGHFLRVDQLLGRNPLAPLPEIDAVGQLKALEFNARRRGTLKVLGQLQRILTLDKRTPQRIVRQLGAAFFHEVVELRLAVVGTRRGENNLQRLALSLPGAVAVDQILTTGELASDIAQLLNGLARSLRQRGKFLDGLGADVNRIHPAARHRQVRGGFQRRDRLGRVDRVNEKEVRPLVRAHRRQVSQVSRVADPPGRGRTRRIELSVDAPRAARGLQDGQLQRIGNNDESCGLDMSSLNRCNEAMPTDRHPMRHIEGRAPHELTVDHARGHVAINLLTLALTTIFEDPLNVDPRAVGHMHREQITATLAGNNRRRQSPTPLAFLSQTHRMLDVPHRRRFVQGKTERAKDLQEGWGTNAHPVPIPVPKAGRNAIHVSDMAQQVNVVRCG